VFLRLQRTIDKRRYRWRKKELNGLTRRHSCSVPCSKAHQQNHPPDPPKQEKPADQTPNAPPPPATTIAAAPIDPSNPFSALATSDKLQLLFKKYPNLPNQLLEIHDATQPPPESPDAASKAIPASLMKGLPANSYHNGGGGGKGQWNHDIGIKNGKAALRRARKASGEDGEAIREYTELILHIMNETNDKSDAAAYVQRQIAEKDTALIERLLAEDRRNQ
jgi:zinc finger HIT domain-containing protein 3